METETEPQPEKRLFERRSAPRRVVNLPTHVTVRGSRVACRLIDVSQGGALLAGKAELKYGSKVMLDLPGIGSVTASVVRVTPTHFALAFPGVVVMAPVT
ncbi:MAG: PilZ domain-containing protein [Proteobacteria bacterium]|nr:PilZ domain-containing protein [Pseudomonadota bacterium]